MVASNSALASEAGLEILRRGGNAVDAAVAVGFALAVTYPEAGNIGGGGYMVIRMADGRTEALDYREVAPLAATRDMYASDSGPDDRSVIGHLASGVPGAVAGMAAALARYGTMPLRDVIQPAVQLAREGFLVDSALARSIETHRALIARFAGAGTFLPRGEPLAQGARLVQPALAHTLQMIADRGPHGFYAGEIADSIAAEMRRGGGLITETDLARYQPLWREPLRASYRGYTMLTMPLSSSGGITMIQALNVLATYDSLPRFGSAAYSHLLGEVLRRTFIDRNAELGDPAFVDVPVQKLTSLAYARSLRRSIDEERATPTAVLGDGRAEGTHTTHYSVVDASGNAVATTTTINDLYGSGVYAAGFFLNNEMNDFTTQPGSQNIFGLVQGEANAIAPGKRMLSSMSPTIVLDRTGAPLLVIGSRGGPRIIASTLQTILNVLDHRMTFADALAAPRIHHQAWPDSLRYEEDGLTSAAADSLQAMGHELWLGDDYIGRVIGVMRVAGGYEGGVDPRTTGGAVGY
jgi:gamma-glutamyltranspeptidase / glutathione hydrolase